MSKIKMLKFSKVAASFLALVMLFSMLPSSFTTVFAATELVMLKLILSSILLKTERNTSKVPRKQMIKEL